MENCFKEIAQHRNRIIHFYHRDFSEQKIRKEIITQQLHGWRHLQKLLKDWKFLFNSHIFENIDKKIADINQLMKANKRFLQEVFN